MDDKDQYLGGAILYVLTHKFEDGATEEEITEAINELTLEEQLEASKIAAKLKERGFGG